MRTVPDDGLHVPPPRPAAIRAGGDQLRLVRHLPGPLHYTLAGGGAHGAVQWGSLQALAETDLRPAAIIGTSVGALTGAILAEDLTCGLERLAYVWAQIDVRSLIGERWLTPNSLPTRKKSSLVDSTAEREALEGILAARVFGELDVPFAAVATDLATGRPVAIDSGMLIPALLASSAIPGVLPPVEIDGRICVDGLASANLPVTLAVRRGARAIVALDTGTREAGEITTAPTKVVARVAAILAAAQRRQQLAAAAHHVPVILLPTPDDLGGTLDFRGTIQVAARSFELGRQFLIDLRRHAHGRLRPGLYARPAGLDSDPATSDVLVQVRPEGQ